MCIQRHPFRANFPDYGNTATYLRPDSRKAPFFLYVNTMSKSMSVADLRNTPSESAQSHVPQVACVAQTREDAHPLAAWPGRLNLVRRASSSAAPVPIFTKSATIGDSYIAHTPPISLYIRIDLARLRFYTCPIFAFRMRRYPVKYGPISDAAPSKDMAVSLPILKIFLPASPFMSMARYAAFPKCGEPPEFLGYLPNMCWCILRLFANTMIDSPNSKFAVSRDS